VNDEIRLVATMDEAEVLLRQIVEQKVITYDTETSGLDWQRNHIVAYVIKPVDCPSYYVPVRHAGGGNVPGCRVPTTADGWRGDLHPFELALAKAARSSATKRWVGHFLDFDLKFTSRAGIDLVGDLEDSWINFSLLDENQPFFSLDAAARWCEVQLKKGDDLYPHIAEVLGEKLTKNPRDMMGHYWRMPGNDPLVVEYGAGDGVTTEQVWAAQQQYLDEDSSFEKPDGTIVDRSLRKVWGVECRLIRTIHRMTSFGIRIDEDELARVDQSWLDEINRLKQSFPAGFKSNAPSQMKELLGKYLDDPSWPRTSPSKRFPNGQLQFNEKALSRVPEGQAILDIRKLEHARDTFSGPLRDKHLWNGRVHCSFNQMKKDDYGTVTGRLSSSNPNLQQVPKRDKKIGRPYRRAFLPEEGHLWCANDYRQQEYVIFADYTQEPTLVAGYTQEPPVDIHQSVADMLGVERDPTAKRMNLGMLYGMGKDSLAGHLQVPMAQAMKWRDEYHKRFPGSKDFLKGAEVTAKRRGFVFTYLGRRRRFPDPRFAYKAGNSIIQGSSADVTKAKMVEVDDYFASEGDYCRLMLQIHDSLDWDQPKGEKGDKQTAEAIRIMRSFGKDDLIQISVPMRTDSTTGDNWSEATYGA
jgi:DNA polymerase-1